VSDALDDGAAIAARRSSTWWLLSRLVTEAPLAPWLDELDSVLASVDPDPTTPLGPESAALLAALRAARVEPEGLTALAVDRTRLLAGVFQNDQLPAPYETVALGDAMNTERVLDVIDAYANAGFDNHAPELGPPDYLGTELRFMALLCYREMEARRGEDAGMAPAWLRRQRRFMDEHLLAWVPAHCECLAAQAATPFYGSVATLLARACRIDRDDIAASLETTPAATLREQAR
jgi:putative dimethyl sulfoxide reductase chaperone